jgi:hypothetical protein
MHEFFGIGGFLTETAGRQAFVFTGAYAPKMRFRVLYSGCSGLQVAQMGSVVCRNPMFLAQPVQTGFVVCQKLMFMAQQAVPKA